MAEKKSLEGKVATVAPSIFPTLGFAEGRVLLRPRMSMRERIGAPSPILHRKPFFYIVSASIEIAPQ